MAKVTITEDGRITEISDISFEEARQLLSTNGHGRGSAHANRARKQGSAASEVRVPNYPAFFQGLSSRGKKLLEILRENKNGITADRLAEQMGFTTTNQIGGVTGGGMGKLASRYHVDMSTIYVTEVKFDNGTRTTIYKPASELFAHKPA
jgi:hypothetical protein